MAILEFSTASYPDVRENSMPYICIVLKNAWGGKDEQVAHRGFLDDEIIFFDNGRYTSLYVCQN